MFGENAFRKTSVTNSLAESVKKVMEESDLHREVVEYVNESLGIEAKKALPYSLHEDYDTLVREINEAIMKQVPYDCKTARETLHRQKAKPFKAGAFHTPGTEAAFNKVMAFLKKSGFNVPLDALTEENNSNVKKKNLLETNDWIGSRLKRDGKPSDPIGGAVKKPGVDILHIDEEEQLDELVGKKKGLDNVVKFWKGHKKSLKQKYFSGDRKKDPSDRDIKQFRVATTSIERGEHLKAVRDWKKQAKKHKDYYNQARDSKGISGFAGKLPTAKKDFYEENINELDNVISPGSDDWNNMSKKEKKGLFGVGGVKTGTTADYNQKNEESISETKVRAYKPPKGGTELLSTMKKHMDDYASRNPDVDKVREPLQKAKKPVKEEAINELTGKGNLEKISKHWKERKHSKEKNFFPQRSFGGQKPKEADYKEYNLSITKVPRADFLKHVRDWKTTAHELRAKVKDRKALQKEGWFYELEEMLDEAVACGLTDDEILDVLEESGATNELIEMVLEDRYISEVEAEDAYEELMREMYVTVNEGLADAIDGGYTDEFIDSLSEDHLELIDEELLDEVVSKTSSPLNSQPMRAKPTFNASPLSTLWSNIKSAAGGNHTGSAADTYGGNTISRSGNDASTAAAQLTQDKIKGGPSNAGGTVTTPNGGMVNSAPAAAPTGANRPALVGAPYPSTDGSSNTPAAPKPSAGNPKQKAAAPKPSVSQPQNSTSDVNKKGYYTGSSNKSNDAYTIKKGETLSGIAKAHNTTVDKIKSMNSGIKDVNKIAAGGKLNFSSTPKASGDNASPATPKPVPTITAQDQNPNPVKSYPKANVPTPPTKPNDLRPTPVAPSVAGPKDWKAPEPGGSTPSPSSSPDNNNPDHDKVRRPNPSVVKPSQPLGESVQPVKYRII